MACKYCDIINAKKDAEIIYIDNDMLAFMPEKPAVPGHIVLVPRNHYTILDQVPDYEISELFNKANKLSSILFETLGAVGTNILINNGIEGGQKEAHFSINILPRFNQDGIEFKWEPKQLSEDESSVVEIQLKEACENIGDFEKKKKKEPVKAEEKKEEIEEKEGERNYIIEQLRRIP